MEKKEVTITMSLEQAKSLNSLIFASVISFASDCDLEEAARFLKIGTIIGKAIKQVQGGNTDESDEENEE